MTTPTNPVTHPVTNLDIPIEQLVDEVYESAPQPVKSSMLAQLVGKVYESAPASEKRRLVEHLMKPLGILSLVAVAGGIFAKMRLQARLDDTQNVQVSDVVDLANFAQQVSTHAIDGLAQVLVASPVLAGSAAAALLIKLIVRRTQTRQVQQSPG